MRASRIVPVLGPPMLLAGLLAGCGAPVQDAAEVASTAAPADAPLYFPPADGPWATVDPGDAGWDAADARAVDQATQPSQDLNPAYGYLWWLNGQSFRLGAAGASRNDGPLIASAPPDLVAAQGALDKKLYVVPSLDLVVTRLGDRGSIEGSSFNDAFWDLLIQAAPPRPGVE